MQNQQRLFSRSTIQQVNKDMIDRKPIDMSGLPPAVVRGIKETKFSREEINRAFSQARRQVAETA